MRDEGMFVYVVGSGDKVSMIEEFCRVPAIIIMLSRLLKTLCWWWMEVRLHPHPHDIGGAEELMLKFGHTIPT
jgi:hypothetical protein